MPTSFNVCYETQDAVATYGLSTHSTWIIIDQEGRIAYRMNNNIDPIMIDIVIDKIDALLDTTP